MRKDLDLALTLFARTAANLPLTELAGSLVSEAALATGEMDITSVIRRYRSHAEETVKEGARRELAPKAT